MDHFDLDTATPDTILAIQTRYSVYNVKILDRRRVLIQGGTTRFGTRYPIPYPVVIAGSSFKGQRDRMGKICKNMRLIIYEDDEKLTTSLVQAVFVENEGGIFKLWDQKEEWVREGF